MPEREGAENTGGSFWPALVAVIIFEIAYRVLSVWFVEPAAFGLAALAVALPGYHLVPERKPGFARWAFVSLLVVAGYAGLIYGVSHLLCGRVGAVVTWGLLGLLLPLSARWVAGLLLKPKVKGGVWGWAAVSIGFGLLFAFLAYINPEGFCP